MQLRDSLLLLLLLLLLLILLQIAKRQAVVNPENTFFSVKRFVGRRMSEVTEECKQVPYQVSRGYDCARHGCNQDFMVAVGLLDVVSAVEQVVGSHRSRCKRPLFQGYGAVQGF